MGTTINDGGMRSRSGRDRLSTYTTSWIKKKTEFGTHVYELSHLWLSSSPAVALSDGFNRNIERRNSTRIVPSTSPSRITPYRSRATFKLTTPLVRIYNCPNLYMSNVLNELINFTGLHFLKNSFEIVSPACNMKDRNLLRPLPACAQDDIALQSMYLLLVGRIAIFQSGIRISVAGWL